MSNKEANKIRWFFFKLRLQVDWQEYKEYFKLSVLYFITESLTSKPAALGASTCTIWLKPQTLYDRRITHTHTHRAAQLYYDRIRRHTVCLLLERNEADQLLPYRPDAGSLTYDLFLFVVLRYRILDYM